MYVRIPDNSIGKDLQTDEGTIIDRHVFTPMFRRLMRYLVKARLKPGRRKALLSAIEDGSLGRSSVAGGEYVRNMEAARIAADGKVSWVEICFCNTPLEEERPYWEEYFELLEIKDAHSRKNCRDLNGTEPWACMDCERTERLESRMDGTGKRFLDV